MKSKTLNLIYGHKNVFNSGSFEKQSHKYPELQNTKTGQVYAVSDRENLHISHKAVQHTQCFTKKSSSSSSRTLSYPRAHVCTDLKTFSSMMRLTLHTIESKSKSINFYNPGHCKPSYLGQGQSGQVMEDCQVILQGIVYSNQIPKT